MSSVPFVVNIYVVKATNLCAEFAGLLITIKVKKLKNL